MTDDTFTALSNIGSEVQMTTEELSKHFNEPIPVEKEAENDQNDLYRIAARVKNLAKETTGSLTPQGEILCNCYAHVLKSFYEFSKTLPEKDGTILHNLIRTHESMPSDVISASFAGIKK